MASQREGVLAVGSGTILIALVKAGYESGLSKITVFVTKPQLTDTQELKSVWEQALLSNSEALLDIRSEAADIEVNWEAGVRPFSFIMYAAQHGDLEELKKLQTACLAEKKPLRPAIGLRGMGIVGPLLHQRGDSCLESVWRRIHASVFPTDWESQPFLPTTAALLSNIVMNEWHKIATGDNESNCSNHCYLLNPLTLEGGWHPILPHPIVSGHEPIRTVTDLELYLEIDHEPDTEEWFAWFSSLTSKVSGIFHVWEEGALNQLPLAQCLVHPVDPLSAGPAELLPTIVSSGLTHVEARRESGLAGVEAYTAHMIPLLVPELPSLQQENIHIGAGFSFAEAVNRGLSACLTQELSKRDLHRDLTLTRMECAGIEDIQCRFYLQCLRILEGEPLLAAGESLFGFPVMWVHSGTSWYGSVGHSTTLALRQALQKALMKTEAAPVTSVIWSNQEPESIILPSGNPIEYVSWVRSAIQALKQHRKYLKVFDMRCESFLREGPIEVVGVLLDEEESL